MILKRVLGYQNERMNGFGMARHSLPSEFIDPFPDLMYAYSIAYCELACVQDEAKGEQGCGRRATAVESTSKTQIVSRSSR